MEKANINNISDFERKDISELLKKYRKLNNYSVKDVLVLMQERSLFVAEKTLYGWENGRSQPSIDALFVLCEIYKIPNVMEAFGYDGGEPFYVSPHEGDVIRQYRRYPSLQTAIDKLLDL
jgi:transcriptional regulator with XRE-family HTH domain